MICNVCFYNCRKIIKLMYIYNKFVTKFLFLYFR